jgi:glycosyltransferase involved in cell wall biosynthesis
MKVALVYDRVNKWGGAERVLLSLHELFPDAPLYTSVYHPDKAKWAKNFPKVIPSFLNKIPQIRDKHELLGIFMPMAFESFDFSEYDLVISITSEAAKGIITMPGTKHLCYCLTPTRYLWSGYEDYFGRGAFRMISRPFISYLRKWDKVAANRPDKFIAISKEVKKRIKKYYKRDSNVVYPGVDPKVFSPKNKGLIKKDYYLVVSRLVPYKKVDLVVQTFNKNGKKLVIIGVGSEEKRLKRMANNNIKFMGYLTEDKLVHYYQEARGLIIPQIEDFGLVSVEAQAAGCAVIACKKGGAIDTVIEGRTGVFFNQQTKQSLMNAIRKFESSRFNKMHLMKNAERFSKKVFKQKMRIEVNRV